VILNLLAYIFLICLKQTKTLLSYYLSVFLRFVKFWWIVRYVLNQYVLTAPTATFVKTGGTTGRWALMDTCGIVGHQKGKVTCSSVKRATSIKERISATYYTQVWVKQIKQRKDNRKRPCLFPRNYFFFVLISFLSHWQNFKPHICCYFSWFNRGNISNIFLLLFIVFDVLFLFKTDNPHQEKERLWK